MGLLRRISTIAVLVAALAAPGGAWAGRAGDRVTALERLATHRHVLVSVRPDSRALEETVMRVVDSGSLVVAASGNSFLSGNPAIYPADTPHVLTVAGIDQADAPAPFSSAGPHVDLAAPGMDIPVQHPLEPDRHALAGGTSFAAPMVSAAAAWIWTLRPGLDASQLAELLRRSARDVGTPGHDRRTGFGVLDLASALTMPAPEPDPGEPNDDIDLLSAGPVLTRAKPTLTGPGRASATVVARLDAVEDRHDVYRALVPARRTLVVTVTPDAAPALRSRRLRFATRPAVRSPCTSTTGCRPGGPARRRPTSSVRPCASAPCAPRSRR